MNLYMIGIFVLLVSCSNPLKDYQPNNLHMFKIGDCYKFNSDLEKDLKMKGVFIYKVVEIEYAPADYTFFPNIKYGKYNVLEYYQNSEGQIEALPHTQSFEYDNQKSKVVCPIT